MFSKVRLVFIFLMSGLMPALAMECPTSDHAQVEKRVADAPSCDTSMQLLLACQLGSSGDVGLSLVVIKKCENDFLASLSASARRNYQRKVASCAAKFVNESGTLFQSVRAICWAEIAHTYAIRAAKSKKR